MITIEIGDINKLLDDIEKINKFNKGLITLGDREETKKEVAILIQQQIMKNLTDSVDADFVPFKPLSEKTKNRKHPPRGGESAKPLLDKGFLLGGFSFELVPNGIVFSNSQFYAIYHQNGTEFIPQRKIFPEKLDEKYYDIILSVFEDSIDEYLK